MARATRSGSGRKAAVPAIPAATYRLQLHRGFPFSQAQSLLGYLADLGISHCYASPLLSSRPGSTHGYDLEDPAVVDPELGGEAGFRTFAAALRRAGLGLLLDIVPNHMAVAGTGNPWWNDVLTHGRGSPFAPYFDIDWHPPQPRMTGRVLLPVLEAPFAQVLEQGLLRVVLSEGVLRVAYHDHRWPLTPRSWRHLLLPLLRTLREADGAPPRTLAALEAIARKVARAPAPAAAERSHAPATARSWDALRERLAALVAAPRVAPQAASVEREPALQRILLDELAALNGTPGDPGSFARLEALLDEQAYRLAHWRLAGEQINYRRFFDINELIGVRVDNPRVFRAAHARVLRMIARGRVQGLRIDHIDGLYDPTAYLRKLRRSADRALRQAAREGHAPAAARGVYLVVEKVLQPRERRRSGWPVQGGTGYDLLGALNAVQVERAHRRAFQDLYARCTGASPAFPAGLVEAKHQILHTSLAGDLHRLALRLERIAATTRAGRDYPLSQLKAALCALIASLPVYRTYVSGRQRPVTREDAGWIDAACRMARNRHPELPAALFSFIAGLLTLQLPAYGGRRRPEVLAFVARTQQLSGAAMAKGMEDTAYYRIFPLASLNEVGGDPGRFGLTVAEFHRFNVERAATWPHGLSATATHDTKRGEDVRARLNALSELPRSWGHAFRHWQRLNAPHKTAVGDMAVPEPRTEYLLYQTLLGAWPSGGRAGSGWADFPERIAAYMEKAVREAKLHTGWHDPNPAYEGALRAFVERVLAPGRQNPFPAALEAFLAPVARAGYYNGLLQTLLKVACPGVPDIYQGTELWDFSLVDPDNRRPVDYPHRRALLAALRDTHQRPAALAARLLRRPEDGRIKLFVLERALALRRARPVLFTQGDYRPLAIAGEKAHHALAFARTGDGQALLVASGRLFLGLLGEQHIAGRPPVGANVWGNTAIEAADRLPPGLYRDALTGREVRPAGGVGGLRFPLAKLFSHLPLALLEHVA